MKRRATALTAFSAALLTMATACMTSEPEFPSDVSPSAETETSTEQSAEPSPETEVAAEGDLQTYNGAPFNFPISAQYPNTMQVDDGCAGEGCGFFFTFLPQGNALDNAEVHIFLPAGVATAAEQEPFVTGPNGLIENAGWVVDGLESGATERFPYPWVETVINFSSDREESGHILLGAAEGQAVQVLLLYPAEMADAYWPGANTILETLEFDPDLLPLSPASEGPVEGEDPATMCDPTQEAC